MGMLCYKSSTIDANEAIIEKELIVHQTYSQFEPFFSKFDDRFNILKDFPLSEFITAITKFQFSTNTTSNIVPPTQLEKFNLFNEECEESDCLSFFKLKVTESTLIQQRNNTEIKTQIFLDFINFFVRSIRKGFSSFSKNNTTSVVTSKKTVKKFCLLAIGVLYCYSDNLTKIGIMFNLLANDSNKLERTAAFEDFVLTLILIASYSHFKGIFDTKSIYPDRILMLSDEDQMKLLNLYTPEKMEKLKNVFFKQFYAGEEEGALTRLDFKERLAETNTGWLIHPNCIRFHLDNI